MEEQDDWDVGVVGDIILGEADVVDVLNEGIRLTAVLIIPRKLLLLPPECKLSFPTPTPLLLRNGDDEWELLLFREAQLPARLYCDEAVELRLDGQDGIDLEEEADEAFVRYCNDVIEQAWWRWCIGGWLAGV
jgi:hypothetical protein